MFLIAWFCYECKKNEDTREPVEDVTEPGEGMVEGAWSLPNNHEIYELSHPVKTHDDEELKADLHIVPLDVEVPVSCPDSPEEGVEKKSIEDKVEGEKDDDDEVKIEKCWWFLL